MEKIHKMLSGGILLFSFAVFIFGCTSKQKEPFKAGFAEVDITPQGGTVYVPLMAKALVVQQGKTAGAIVVCDIIAIDRNTVDQARELITAKTGIPGTCISISCTHTHSAGHIRDLPEKIAQSVADAYNSLAEMDISTGTVVQDSLAFNRRFLMIDGSVRMNPGIDPLTGTAFENGYSFMNKEIIRPVGPVDKDVPLVYFYNKTNKSPIGALSSFAMHTCVAGPAYNADYPGYMAAALKEVLGRNFVSVFGEGTCGDINHWDVTKPQEGQNGPEAAARIGQTLASTVAGAIPGLSPSDPDLKIMSKVVDVPLKVVSEMDIEWAKSASENKFSGFQSTAFNNRSFLAGVRARNILTMAELWKTRTSTPLEVQVFRISDNTAVVTLPGEVFVELGLAIKGESPFKNTFVIELANDGNDYIPALKSYSEGGYEVVSSINMPGGGEMLVDAALEMLAALKVNL